jgi:hypothetical protein
MAVITIKISMARVLLILAVSLEKRILTIFKEEK